MYKNNKKIIEIFYQLYEIYSATNDEYRAKSYKKTIDILNKYPHKIDEKHLNDIDSIKGIGDKTIIKIKEIIKTGNLKTLQNLKKNSNINTHIELQKVLGIGPKFSSTLIKKYNIKSIDELKKSNIPLNHTQKIGLKYFKEFNTPMLRSYILKYKNRLQKQIKKFDPNAKLILAGSYLTKKKLANDIDIIIITNKSSKNLAKFLLDYGIAIEIINQGKYSIMYVSEDKKHIDIKLIDKKLLPFYLIYFGSGEIFAREIRLNAKKMGYKLSQYGLFDRKTGKVIMDSAENENEIFKKLNMKYIKPQNR